MSLYENEELLNDIEEFVLENKGAVLSKLAGRFNTGSSEDYLCNLDESELNILEIYDDQPYGHLANVIAEGTIYESAWALREEKLETFKCNISFYVDLDEEEYLKFAHHLDENGEIDVDKSVYTDF